jgi:hypothetical protein
MLDSPFWSYFHGCLKHPGQIPPCPKCVAARDPDVTGWPTAPAPPSSGPAQEDWAMYSEYVARAQSNDTDD